VAPVLEGKSHPVYTSYLVVREDSAYNSIEDLNGKIVAFNDANSLSGCLSAKWYLNQRNKNKFFSYAIETGSHEASLNLVSAGGAACAFVDEQVYKRLQHRFEAKVRIIDTTTPLPIQPFVIARRVAEKNQNAIREAMVNLHTTTQGQRALKTLGFERFVAISEADYSIIETVVQTSRTVTLSSFGDI